jgi:hypothetical protein
VNQNGEDNMTQRFKIHKLGRRANPENPEPPQVSDGLVFESPTLAAYVPLMTSIGAKEWCVQKDLRPLIDSPIQFREDGVGGVLTISRVRSYYKHCDKGEHPDKLVLPKDFPIEENIEIPKMKDGDYLIATMNSIYYLEIQ